MSTLHSVLLLSLLVGTTAQASAFPQSSLDPVHQEQGDQQVLNVLLADTVQRLANEGIEATVTARVKSTQSVHAKMRRKGVAFHEIYDRLALRIHVETEDDCYAARQLVESQHAAILTERDDYIAHPKGNGYRSLHTAVRTVHGDVAEFQIRTHEMHNHAEQGGAAHSVYKRYA